MLRSLGAGAVGLTTADELSATIEEAARRRELDRLMKFSVSRDGFPLAWRRALRFILLISLINGCQAGEAGALPLLTMHLNAMRCASRRGSSAMHHPDSQARISSQGQ